MGSKSVRVLVVDDSPVARESLTYIIESDPAMEVVGTASNGVEAVEAVGRLKPDVVLMDVNMPKMDGIEATRRIMEVSPTPIVIQSATWSPEELAKTFHTFEAGALAILEKPPGVDHPDFELHSKEIIRTTKLMSEVKVVSRRPRAPGAEAVGTPAPPKLILDELPKNVDMLAIGASTGGPPALDEILSRLEGKSTVPILVVQHIWAGFLPEMVRWLGDVTGLTIQLAAHGDRLDPGHVYFAPSDLHTGVDSGRRVALSDDPPENGVRPSVSHLFRSVARAFGPAAVGIVLTGMGKDGADGMKLMKDAGALTIAQDRESSIVYGMPGEAMKIGAARYVLSLENITEAVAAICGTRGK